VNKMQVIGEQRMRVHVSRQLYVPAVRAGSGVPSSGRLVRGQAAAPHGGLGWLAEPTGVIVKVFAGIHRNS
jgi:hypothetical protein